MDSSDFDAFDARDGSVDDALNAESEDYGFVWATDESEAADQNTNQSDDAASSTEPLTDPPPNSQFEWNSPTERRAEQSIDDGHDASYDSEPRNSMIGENATDETAHTHSAVESGVDEDATPETDHDSSETVVSGSSSERPDDSEKPEEIAIDPIDYPVDELRTIADCVDADVVSSESASERHGFVWSEPPEQHRTHVEDPTTEQGERLLAIAGIDPERIGEKPYLTTLSAEDAEAFITGWLEFLTTEAGTQGAIDAIERYCEIGWMTEPVAEELEERLQWIDHRNGNGFETFDRGDHLLNFAYVAKIASLSAEGMMFY